MIRSAIERIAPFAEDHGLPLNEPAIDRLAIVISLLEVWNRRTRMTGDKDLETIVSKHCADSIVAASELSAAVPTMDVGSGAGFPGLVAACVRRDLDLTLVDARQKSCSFLEAAAARAGLLNVRVLNARVEDLSRSAGESPGYGAVVSRAVDLTPLLPALRSLMVSSGVLLMMLSGRQIVHDGALNEAGFTIVGERLYQLPTGEDRRIARYAPV